MTIKLPADHDVRIDRARLSLDGLSVGDGFGARFFFGQRNLMEENIARKAVPWGPWRYTDDTIMALGIYSVLMKHGLIDQDELAQSFTRNFAADKSRGYGRGAREMLEKMSEGENWKAVSYAAFEKKGSMGNGGAMRVAPLGAYFSDDIQALIEEARKSAEVTHAHAEGQAGAIAIALAAAFAWNERKKLNENTGTKLIEFVLEHTPEGETREGIRKALGLERSLSVQTAASFLGNGSRVISQDTVPFTLWCAARHLNNFCGAMWTTVSGLGDRDTNCAIVGGIVALSAGAESIPADWVQAREPLKF